MFMFIDFLLKIFETNKEKDAIIWKNEVYSYDWLLHRINYWMENLKYRNIKNGSVVVLESDFSPNTIALFISLIESGCIIAPISKNFGVNKQEMIELVQGEVFLVMDGNDNLRITNLSYLPNHELYRKLKTVNHPGLILFSSGSTGKIKAAVHDFINLLEKFKVPRICYKTISFLLYDHIGGINTLFYVLSNAGCLVTIEDRSPDSVLNAVEMYKVELLPTSPTFINLILLSEAYKRYCLNSLKLITYGTEPMPESTLNRFNGLFPEIKLLQTYGLSELGILRSKSKSSNSLWVKVGGEGIETRIVDGILQIKSNSTMLGYLNHKSPFTEDGWFDTGDVVEVDGEYIKILGRKSELINVGGQKVFPIEVENIIQQLDNVLEVAVYGEKNPIVNNIVCAKITQKNDEDREQFILRIKKYCREKMENYKVPVKIYITKQNQHNDRFKKIRN